MSYGAGKSYKHTFVCVGCRKGFKQTEYNSHKCPDCGLEMVDKGFKFEVPRKRDLKSWESIHE